MTQFLAVRLSITVLSLLLAPMPWLFMAMYLMFIVLQQLMSTTQLTAVMLLRFTAVSLMMVVCRPNRKLPGRASCQLCRTIARPRAQLDQRSTLRIRSGFVPLTSSCMLSTLPVHSWVKRFGCACRSSSSSRC